MQNTWVRENCKGKCFVIMPFEERLNTYYNELIKPLVDNLHYKIKRADEIYSIHTIIDDIISEIKSADFLIADVTGKNPNVNYELGYADALNKSVILISQSLEDVPFDYRHRRIIIYNPAKGNWQKKLCNDLKNTILTIESTVY